MPLVVVSLMRPRCFTNVVHHTEFLHTELLHTERNAVRMICSCTAGGIFARDQSFVLACFCCAY